MAYSCSARQPRFKQSEGGLGEEFLEPGGDRECWMCSGSGPALIAPCQCAGSMKWVHRQCLDRRRADATNPQSFTHCRHCGAAFQMVLRRPTAADDQEFQACRRRFVRGVISNFARRAALLQLVLCALAMAIRALDPKERLVVLFDLRQIEGTPPGGIGDYWNAILHHKSTYYLAAVLVGLFCAGLAGAVVLCRRPCCARTCQLGGDPDLGPGWDRRLPSFLGASPPRNRNSARRRLKCADDCCAFCGVCCRNVECPACEQGGCRCHDASGCCPSASGDCRESAACLLWALLVAVVMLVAAGIFFALVASMVWLHRVLTRYTQVVQLRALTREYIVRDLSEDAAAAGDSKQLLLDVEGVALGAPAPAQQEIGQAPGVPPGDAAVRQSLMMDLQAVYGTRQWPQEQ